MMTPTHLIIAASLFAKPDQQRVTWAALAGGMAPDLSLYLMAGTCIFILGIDPKVVFDQLYFSDAWQTVFAIDNSFLLWGAGCMIAYYWKSVTAFAFAVSGFVHLLLDFPLHHDDGRAHFWPLSDWVFESPVSYWDDENWGHIVAPLETLLAIVLLVILFRRFHSTWARSVICIAMVAQIGPGIAFWFIGP